jgi:putative ABC transport system ATP-binding protein
MAIIQLNNICRNYINGSLKVKALRDISLGIDDGEFVAIMGPSGSGKSTLMNILGCLDKPSSGSYLLEGKEVAAISESNLAEIRNRHIGFVFQTFNLLNRASALKNVALPLIYNRTARKSDRAMEALRSVGLEDRAGHHPNQLSGGQQQRVAIARALVNDPYLILCDEPTGNLDTRTSEEILSIFQRLNKEGKTVILVTHELDVAKHARKIIKFRDGRIVSQEEVLQPLIAEEILQNLPLDSSDSENDQLSC